MPEWIPAQTYHYVPAMRPATQAPPAAAPGPGPGPAQPTYAYIHEYAQNGPIYTYGPAQDPIAYQGPAATGYYTLAGNNLTTTPADGYYTYLTDPPAPAPAAPAGPATHVAPPLPKDNVYWYGLTPEQVDAQNHTHAQRSGANNAYQLAPAAQADQEFWVRELDASYTLRKYWDINENLQPGYWTTVGTQRPYFVRQRTA
ncbi:MAG: hypothetical protein M1834_005021 [Cirrosporium novae-zelandiae]|nr:MAG: hypothetical protein M1834_005021 [Cirrosporium novae-zelandiae]